MRQLLPPRFGLRRVCQVLSKVAFPFHLVQRAVLGFPSLGDSRNGADGVFVCLPVFGCLQCLRVYFDGYAVIVAGEKDGVQAARIVVLAKVQLEYLRAGLDAEGLSVLVARLGVNLHCAGVPGERGRPPDARRVFVFPVLVALAGVPYHLKDGAGVVKKDFLQGVDPLRRVGIAVFVHAKRPAHCVEYDVGWADAPYQVRQGAVIVRWPGVALAVKLHKRPHLSANGKAVQVGVKGRKLIGGECAIGFFNGRDGVEVSPP